MAFDARHFSRGLTRAFLVPLLALAALAAVMAWETTALVWAMRSVDHTDQVTTTARYLLRLVLEEESGVRGYLLTGDETFLQSYRDAEPQIPPTFSTLLSLTTDNPSQHGTLEHMQSDVRDWQQYAQNAIAMKRAGSKVDDVALNLEGKRRMDRIRTMRDEFLEHEESLRDMRVRSVVRRTVAVLFTALGVSIVMGILLGVWTRRQMMGLARVYGKTVETAERRAEKLHENEAWLGAILNSIADAVIATDGEGKVRFINDVACRLTGWTEEKPIGEQLTRVFPAVNERTGESIADLSKSVQTESAKATQPETALLRNRKQMTVPVDVVIAPIREIDGKTGIVLVARDLSDRRQSEAALRSSDKLANIGRLAATVAHEIHNPLDAIGNLLYLLEHSGTVSDTDRAHVRLAREELDRVAQITQQMLNFNRESREPVPVSLRDILENVLTLYHGKITQRRTTLERRFEEAMPITAFPGELRQVFSNLVGNALESLPSHGKLTVSLRNSRDWRDGQRHGVRVNIVDSGSGIPIEYRPRITQPFFTTKGEKGTGLGLWVSRGIVEKYGGSMRFRSSTKPGKSGTMFSIFLPARNEPTQREQQVG